MTVEEQKLNDLKIRLDRLNAHINGLTVWNNYAEDQQREYDHLLGQYNNQLKLVKDIK